MNENSLWDNLVLLVTYEPGTVAVIVTIFVAISLRMKEAKLSDYIMMGALFIALLLQMKAGMNDNFKSLEQKAMISCLSTKIDYLKKNNLTFDESKIKACILAKELSEYNEIKE